MSFGGIERDAGLLGVLADPAAFEKRLEHSGLCACEPIKARDRTQVCVGIGCRVADKQDGTCLARAGFVAMARDDQNDQGFVGRSGQREVSVGCVIALAIA